MFHGSIVALVTPMTPDGAIDFTVLSALVEWHIAEGTDAIVAVGTTGESGTLSAEEKLSVIRHVVTVADNRIPVIAGTAAQGTRETLALTEQAMQAGADAALIMTPAYIKPTQEGLYQHYLRIAKAVPLPIILYNVPSRTACDMLPETVIRLAEIPTIIGVKEATGDLAHVTQIHDACHEKLDIFSGDDLTALALIQHGGKGVISVTANVAPKLFSEFCHAAIEGDGATAEALNERLMPLNRALFLESNPIPTKFALTEMDKIPQGIRLPLTPLSEEHQASLRQALRGLHLV